jgi:uncharacterized protein
MHVFYLHGFASSARSSKAMFIGARLEELGLSLHVPDFNQPDFTTLTISRMVEQVGRAIDALPPAPVVLVGSSLGGFVAVQVALRHRTRVDRLVLLAPALDFGGNRMRSLGDVGIGEWKRTNRLNVFHYGFGRVMSVHYQLYADARRYDSMNASLSIPVQIFQGTRDDAVDPATVEQWARARPNAELHLLDDDHQLGANLDVIWKEMRRFIGVSDQAAADHQQMPW